MQFHMMVGLYCFWKANIKLFSSSRSGDRVKYPVMAKSILASIRLATMRSREGKSVTWKNGLGC